MADPDLAELGAPKRESDPLALELHGVSLALGGRPVLKEVSLTARFGELSAILGPNGAGKTSLLRRIAGLLEGPGEVRLSGVALSDLEPLERAKQVSFVPQQSMLRVAMPVHAVVALGRYAHRPGLTRRSADDEAAIRAALEETDTLRLSERPFIELSFGEQKRVMIARALATGARTLLLDEPTASLDVEHALRLFVLLRALVAQGRCIVAVLHQLDEAMHFADRVALLKDGVLVAHGPTAEIITPARVRQIYGVEMIPGGGFGFRLPAEEAP
jgi:iron complex transport system ATP-binding protein